MSAQNTPLPLRPRFGGGIVGRHVSHGRPSTNFTVLLKGLPVDADEEDVEAWASADSLDLRPMYSEEDAIQAMEKLMSQVGSILSFRRLPRHGTRQKCLVSFQDSGEAAKAVERFNRTQQSAIGKGTLCVKTLWSLRLYILARHFLVIQPELKDICQRLQQVQARTRLHMELGETRATLTLSGDDPKDFSAVKRTIQQLIEGDPVVDAGGSLVWDAFLESPAGTALISGVNQETGAFILRDSKKQMLTVSGKATAKDTAKELIIKRLGARRFIGPIESDVWRYLLTGGLQELKMEIGEDTVSLDVSRRLLLVRGQEDAFRAATMFMRNATTSARPGGPLLDPYAACPICLCDPTNPVRLGCNHAYCHACLKNYLLSTSEAGSFPIVCVSRVGEGACSVPVSLAVVSRVLATEQERHFLNAAFTAHVRRHPTQIRNCPTADCDWVYKPRPGGGVIMCDACLQRICTACHVFYHEGVSCEDHRAGISPGERAFMDYKKQNNVKQCPKCGIDIFKDGGCNHVTCQSCKAHICWVCMQSYDTDRPVYTHMRTVHGSIGG